MWTQDLAIDERKVFLIGLRMYKRLLSCSENGLFYDCSIILKKGNERFAGLKLDCDTNKH